MDDQTSDTTNIETESSITPVSVEVESKPTPATTPAVSVDAIREQIRSVILEELKSVECIKAARRVMKSSKTSAKNCKYIEDGKNYVVQQQERVGAVANGLNEAEHELKQKLQTIQSTATEIQDLKDQVIQSESEASESLNSLRAHTAQSEQLLARLGDMSPVAEQIGHRFETASENLEEIIEHRMGVQRDAESVAALSKDASARMKQLQERAAAADSASESIQRLLKQSEDCASKSKTISDTATAAESKVKEYEEALQRFSDRFEESHARIESLLPGATSAGLAEAFQNRRRIFVGPQKLWQATFVLSVLALFVLAAIHFRVGQELTHFLGDGSRVSKTPLEATAPIVAVSWSEWAIDLSKRVLVALPLIWLAIHSARQANLGSRLEEEYAFKETIAKSFEGFRKQLHEIDKESLREWCTATLSTLTREPQRLFDSKTKDPTPATALVEAVKAIRKDGDGEEHSVSAGGGRTSAGTRPGRGEAD